MIRDLDKEPFYGVIKEYKYWVVLFRYRQVTIGSLIIMSKSDKSQLGDLSTEQWAGFAEASHDVETWLKDAFGAEKFNYLALMMKDPEVHFHVIPRYSKPVAFAGKEFIDPDWPLATERKALELDTETLDAIKQRILEVAQ
jgi:diadenosine tetraphosphate (Ap4A) HIT family hydrolase